MKKILITGSSGYIGSHLLKKIKDLYIVYGLDKQETQVPVDLIYADITNLEDLKQEYEFDCIIHLAAEVRVGESVKDPILYYETNINGTLNVLKHFKTKNFILASTGAAEGLSSPYGISKKAAEEITQQFCIEKNINYTIFRFYNIIGTDGIDVKNPDGLFFNLIKSKETGVFKVFGNDYNTPDGTCIRDYVHVYEICEAIKKAINEPSNSIESLGHGKGHSVLEIVKKFIDINQIPAKIEFTNRRLGDLEKSVLSNISPYMKNLYSINDLLKL